MLFEECPNPHILDLVHRGWNRMRMLRDSSFSFVPGRARDSVAEHDRILDLIEARADPLEIELAARHHRTATLDAVLAYQAQHRPPASRMPRGLRRPHPDAAPTDRTRTDTDHDPRDTRARDMTHHIPTGLPDRIRHFIDGEFVDSVGGETFDVLDPVTNETYVQAAAGQQADVDLAVAAARRAFTDGPWPRMLPRARARDPAPHRRPRRGAGRPARRARDLRHRPADHAGARARRSARPRTSGSSPT